MVTILGLAALSDVREYARFVIEIRNGLGIEPNRFSGGVDLPWSPSTGTWVPLGSPLSDSFRRLEFTASKDLVVAFDVFGEQFAKGGERVQRHEHKGEFKEW